MADNPFVGSWTYRSFLNDPVYDPNAQSQPLFGSGTIVIAEASSELLIGTIGGDGWGPLQLHGSRGYGSPAQVRFQGKGLDNGEEWIYDYIGWFVPVWPNSTELLQRPAIVGSVVRTIPHSSGNGGTAPAGVVASFFAVKVS